MIVYLHGIGRTRIDMMIQADAAAARETRKGTCAGGCETKLVEEAFRTLVIQRCPTCGGVWLDPGALEQLAPDESGVVRDFLRFFRGKSGT